MWIVTVLFLLLPYDNMEAIIDFSDPQQMRDWVVVNDGVMGGLSRGKVELTETGALFSGRVSLENNGGFASFRSPYSRIDLSSYDSLEIRYKSTGLPCAMSFYRYSQFWRPNNKLPLELSDDWTTVRVSLLDLAEYRMGSKTGNTISRDQLNDIIRIGFITDSKKEGNFEFEVDYVKFVSTN